MMVKRAVRTAAVVGLMPVLLLAACDDIEIGDVVGVDGVAVALTGFWQGVGEVTTTDDRVGAAAGTQGFQFPIALDLREDRTFTLWTAHFPVDAGVASESRTCSGAYTVRGGIMSLFPDRLCRALPLARYTVRRTGVGRILLEAAGAEPGGDAASVRVRLVLERVEVPGIGIGDDDEG